MPKIRTEIVKKEIDNIFYATPSTNERKLHKEAKLAKKKLELGIFIVDQYIYSITFPKV